MSEIKSVPQALADLAKIYEQRGCVYGDDFMHIGETLMGLFPSGVHLKDSVDFNRFALLVQCVTKVGRYAQCLTRGTGHEDSLNDLAVYSQLLQHFDSLAESKKAGRELSRPNGEASTKSSDDVYKEEIVSIKPLSPDRAVKKETLSVEWQERLVNSAKRSYAISPNKETAEALIHHIERLIKKIGEKVRVEGLKGVEAAALYGRQGNLTRQINRIDNNIYGKALERRS